MDRRSFVSLLPLGAAAVVHKPTEAVARGIPDGIRVSSEKGDPGERLYCQLCGDKKRVRIFLDGAEQQMAVTADERLGMVKRAVLTPKGNLAVNHATGEIFHEEVYGAVRIEIVG